MDLLYVKIICLVVIFLVNFIFFVPPIFMKNALQKRKRTFELVTSLMNHFCTGVIFGTLVLDVWPHGLEMLEEAIASRNIKIDYPLAPFCVGIGFFLLFVFEEFQDRLVSACSSCTKCQKKKTIPLSTSDQGNYNLTQQKGHDNGHINYSLEGNEEKFDLQGSNKVDVNRQISSISDAATIQDVQASAQASNIHTTCAVHDHSNEVNVEHKKNMVLVVISLSIHSFFDGIILGVKNNEEDMWKFLFAVALHHSVMSFSVGCYSSSDSGNTSVRKATIKHIVLACIWSSFIPLGIVVTLFQNKIDNLITSILTNIATGTFLYVTFVELLPDTIHKKAPYKVHLILMFIGFAITCIFDLII